MAAGVVAVGAARETLGVVGAGTMGAGIAQVALEAGWLVRVFDPFPGATERGRGRVADGLRRRTRKHGLEGKAASTWVAERLDALDAVGTLEELGSSDLVIEAAIEDLAAKEAIFADLDARAGPGTILATNTSALSISAIAEAAARHPERVVGLHFFNPAPVLLLVEVVAGRQTDPAVADHATATVAAWGKTPVRSADSPGFIVNRVNRPFTIEALRMVEDGRARVAEIDAAVRGDGFPMGPFELMDLVGLDVNLAAATSVWEGLGRPDRLRPSPIQRWLAAHERLGRKTGVGFYRYDAGHDQAIDPLPRDLVRPLRGRSLAPEVIVRRIRTAIAEEAVLARDEGVASADDIDTALWLGAAHPQGPFAWARRHDPTIGA
jgi:3-hydroxybutyryl-CoA dehydrogenase